VPHVLIKWSRMDKELATGKTRKHCDRSFLMPLLGVKQVFKTRGMLVPPSAPDSKAIERKRQT
jgi:hypothetical protein